MSGMAVKRRHSGAGVPPVRRASRPRSRLGANGNWGDTPRLTGETPAPLSLKIDVDPVESAKIVGLHYVSDNSPGISREPSGKGFRYRSPSGKLVRDPQVLQRIK